MKYSPLKMRPCYKEYLWGGDRLYKEYNKTDAPDITAESWELSANKDGFSRVAEGAFEGHTIQDLGRLDRKGFWGTACKNDMFPLMVKLIDAKSDLSIQVHPSDETARPESGEHGKAEMWYIADCLPGSKIYFGFSSRLDKEEFERRCSDGSICEVLNDVPVKRGDVFYILPGTIHAIGAGIVIAEIQQNSNTTFRVYDYKRRDALGNLRQLHLERAKEVLSYVPVIPEECRANGVVAFPEFTMTDMFSCRHFQAYRFDIRTHAEFLCDGESFQHILCVEGSAEVYHGNKRYCIKKGDSYFMPAAMGSYQIVGTCCILLSKV